MVATLAPLHPGVHEYHLSLTHVRYLEQGGEPPGVWNGETAKRLGLSGDVTRDELSNLLEGRSPDGSFSLVENCGRSTRTLGVDLCFSAPKELSLFWALGDSDSSLAARSIHRDSVEETLQTAEDLLSFTRRGRGGLVLEKTSLLAARFEHGSSRPAKKDALPDPQLHDHLLIANIAPRADGTWGTLDLRPFFRNVTTLGAIYDLASSYRFEKTFGIKVERKEKGSWGVKGFPRETIREFSKRTEVIEERLAEELLSTSKARKQVTLHTRHTKRPMPRNELFVLWKEKARDLGVSMDLFLRPAQKKPKHSSQEAAFDASIRLALSEITEHESHFSYFTLLRLVAQNAHGRGLSPKTVIEQTRSFLDQSPDIVPLAERDGEMQFTTREMFDLEKSLLTAAENRGRQSSRHVLREGTVRRAMRTAFSKFAPTDEQLDAIEHLTRTKGSIKVLTGEAGTGKSTLLTALRIAYEKKGFAVIGGALAARTARGLKRDTEIESLTLAKLFTMLDRRSPLSRIKENLSLRPLAWDLLHGRGIRNRSLVQESPLPKRCVFVLDEAGMVGTRDMERLVREVERVGGKLILTGDPEQLQPIAAGLPMAALAKRVGGARLSKIVRQKETWAQDAGRDQRRGRSSAALAAYAERGLLFVEDTMGQAVDKLVAHYRAIPGRLAERLVVAASNSVVRRLNLSIQQARLDAGEIGGSHLEVNGYRFHKGDRILFLKNNSITDISNGDTGEVVSVGRLRNTLSVKLDRDPRVTVSVSQYKDVALAYAVTVHKAQGMSVNHAFVLAGGSMQDRELSYVELTRAREQTAIYTSSRIAGERLSELSASMRRSRKKELAHDVLQTPQR